MKQVSAICITNKIVFPVSLLVSETIEIYTHTHTFSFFISIYIYISVCVHVYVYTHIHPLLHIHIYTCMCNWQLAEEAEDNSKLLLQHCKKT